MKKIFIVLSIILLSILLSGCYTVYPTEITERYNVIDYKIHDIGIETWTDGENNYFILNENVYLNEQENNNTVIVTYDAYYDMMEEDGIFESGIQNIYLYLKEEDFKSYIKEKYDL